MQGINLGLGLLVLALLVLIGWFATRLSKGGKGEGFASREAVRMSAAARKAFAEGHTSYGELKKRAGCDIVQFQDLWEMFKAGALSAENLQRVM